MDKIDTYNLKNQPPQQIPRKKLTTKRVLTTFLFTIIFSFLFSILLGYANGVWMNQYYNVPFQDIMVATTSGVFGFIGILTTLFFALGVLSSE